MISFRKACKEMDELKVKQAKHIWIGAVIRV
jgi:hypothetical protein